MQKQLRMVADQRFDLPDLNQLNRNIDNEFQLYNKEFICALNYITKGFQCEPGGGLVLQTKPIDSLVLNSFNASAANLYSLLSADSQLTVTLADNATNYVELRLYKISGNSRAVAIWDPAANAGDGEEFTQTSNTTTYLMGELVTNVSAFTGSPDRIPVCVVTTSGGTFLDGDIVDARDLLFSLANEWDFGVVRTDTSIKYLKHMFDALMTILKEVKGSDKWYTKQTGLSLQSIWNIITDTNTYDQNYVVTQSDFEADTTIFTLPLGENYFYGTKTLRIHFNGVLQVEGLGYDYIEIDDGGGYGTTIQVSRVLPPECVIRFRTDWAKLAGFTSEPTLNTAVEVLAGPITIRTDVNKMRFDGFHIDDMGLGYVRIVPIQSTAFKVYDEGVLISATVNELNFVGENVQAVEATSNRVQVTISGGSGGSQDYISRLKINNTGALIPAYRAVCLAADSSIVLADADVLATSRVYGVTKEDILPGFTGPVVVQGFVPNAALGKGWANGIYVYLDQQLGELVDENNLPPDSGDSIVKVGIVDANDLLLQINYEWEV